MQGSEVGVLSLQQVNIINCPILFVGGKNSASVFQRVSSLEDEMLEAPWRDTHNADPGRKKERMLTELTELTVTKNTPDLRTLVTTHQSWVKNNLPERKNLTHSSDHRGLQTVKEDEILCSLIRTAHEINYR
jgi:hypothetical protein